MISRFSWFYLIVLATDYEGDGESVGESEYWS